MKEEQIIIAAKKLFESFGYRRVSMDEIAREANVTKKTVYSYFASKEDLLKYLIDEEVKVMKDIVEKNEDKNKTFFENLHVTIIEIIKYTQNKNFLKLLIAESESFKNPVIIENLKVIDNTIQKYIKEKIQKAVDSGEIKVNNIDVMVFLIFKMYVALLLEWDEKQEKLDENQIADSIISLLKNGLENK